MEQPEKLKLTLEFEDTEENRELIKKALMAFVDTRKTTSEQKQSVKQFLAE
jgi:hypothetical protein